VTGRGDGELAGGDETKVSQKNEEGRGEKSEGWVLAVCNTGTEDVSTGGLGSDEFCTVAAPATVLSGDRDSKPPAWLWLFRPHGAGFQLNEPPRLRSCPQGKTLPLLPRSIARWSMVLINTVPRDHPTPFSQAECHDSDALQVDNPSYRSLRVTQLDSWVKALSPDTARQEPCLVVAFGDTGGSVLKSLLANRSLPFLPLLSTLRSPPFIPHSLSCRPCRQPQGHCVDTAP
jgi:hypothetical protein